MKSLKIIRLWVIILFLIAVQIPVAAYGTEKDAKVYFEKECLALFASHALPSNLADNETRVEEKRGMVNFEKVIVTETREGAVVDTYIQVRNCRVSEPGDHL